MSRTFYNEALDAHIRFDGDDGFVLSISNPAREEEITDEEILGLYNDGKSDGWRQVA
jgi:hypothetical protein